MKTIYLYVLDTMADWEVGYVTAELNSQRYLKEQNKWQVKTCALNKTPIVTMGGMTIVPDYAVNEVSIENSVMLILPGADIWLSTEQSPILTMAHKFLGNGVPVAAICGATGALAQAGMLDDFKHTSNGLPYLHMFCPQYAGDENYVDELAVAGGNVITAGSSAPVEFAYQIFKRLDVFKPGDLERWYGYFAKHSAEDLMELLGSLQGQRQKS